MPRRALNSSRRACRFLLRRGDEQRAQAGLRDLGRIAPDVRAVIRQHLDLVADRVGIAEPVPHVRVLRHQPERLLLAAAADQDLRSARLHRLRDVVRVLDVVPLPLERRPRLREHRPADLQRVLQPLEPLGRRRPVVAVREGLLLVPRRADAEDRATRRDHVERRDHLGQERRVPVRHARHHRAELDPRRACRDGAEDRVRLEHRIRCRADVPDLVVVVHHPERIEPRTLGRLRDLRDAVEQPVVGNVGEREARELQSERGHGSR